MAFSVVGSEARGPPAFSSDIIRQDETRRCSLGERPHVLEAACHRNLLQMAQDTHRSEDFASAVIFCARTKTFCIKNTRALRQFQATPLWVASAGFAFAMYL